MKINYIVIPLITVLVATLGSWFTSGGINSGWYSQITKPVWTPSGSFIGIVWTTIFVLSTISVLIVWNKAPHNSRFKLIIFVFIINAFLNVLWSFVFFQLHFLGLAVLEAIRLWTSVAILIFIIWSVSRLASILLLPYAAWVAFATYLAYMIWRLNS